MSKTSGRIKFFQKFWEQLTQDNNILEYVTGYKIPFAEKVVQINKPKVLTMSKTEFENLFISIQDLIAKGSIQECQPRKDQFISPYFLVDKPNGEKRFILNLKLLNEFIHPPHFKLEDHKTVIKLLSPNCYMACIDLKDAYFLVPIAKEFKKYLRFEFNEKTYEFNCLPFGLCTAPFVFTKLMKPVAQLLRSEGLLSVIYLDDILLIANTKELCQENVTRTREVLESLGFILNIEKSCLNPSQQCKFLGFIYNSIEFTVELPQEKREKILKLVKIFQNKSKCTIREFAECVGVLVSACPAVKYGWLYTKLIERYKYLALEKCQNNFDESMKISREIIRELDWWKRKILIINNPIRNSNFLLEIFSDSSLTGWGACLNNQRTRGWWDVKDQKESINFLELKAVFYALKCFASNYSSCQILLRVDNKTAISYVNRMGGIQYPKLNNLARQIWQWCESKNIWIFASYIKSKDNVIADKESRRLPIETEWELNDDHFRLVKNRFGPFDIDLFATNINRKCVKFISWYKDPESWSVDAFTVSWTQFYFYAFPPFSLILRVLKKIMEDKAEGIVIVPNWPTQAWFPLFLSLLVEKPFYLGPELNLLKSPFRKNHPLARNLTLVVGKLSAKRSGGEGLQNRLFHS